MPTLNTPGGQIGVTVLQAGTPESIEAVVDKWLDSHIDTEVVSMELEIGSGMNAPLYLMIVYKRDRRARRN